MACLRCRAHRPKLLCPPYFGRAPQCKPTQISPGLGGSVCGLGNGPTFQTPGPLFKHYSNFRTPRGGGEDPGTTVIRSGRFELKGRREEWCRTTQPKAQSSVPVGVGTGGVYCTYIYQSRATATLLAKYTYESTQKKCIFATFCDFPAFS